MPEKEKIRKKNMSLLSSLIAQAGCILRKVHSVLCPLQHQFEGCIAQNPYCVPGFVFGGGVTS